MNQKIQWVALIAVAIIATTALVFSSQALHQKAATQLVGGTTNYNDLSLRDEYGTTTLGIYSPENNSSTVGGCIEVNATSSATKLNLRFAPNGATSTFNGTVYWAYGTCK